MEKVKINSKGITLIALVVTIVVLIILAVISINAVLGDNGIIRRAEQARQHQANAEVQMVPSTIDGEKSVDTGFVIKEGDDGSLRSGINEFVWVPVPEISDIYDAENDSGQLWDFNSDNHMMNPRNK